MHSPFERLLGPDFERLPTPVQRVHSLREPLRTAGRSDVMVVTGFFPWLICWIAGLPRAGRDVDVSIRFEPNETGGEHWDRKFADRRYTSSIDAGTGPDQGFLIEHFGLFDLRFQLIALPEGLAWSLVGWRLLSVPLPRWSVPRVESLESADSDRLTFDIDVAFPFIGWLIHYRGWLLPQDDV